MKDAVEPMEEGESVVRRYAPMVYRLALAQVRGRCDAEDIFQEVFLRYFRSAPVFSEEEHRRAWLIRVTVNCAKKFWTSAWMRRTVLWEQLQLLPGKYRAVLHLFYYEQLSVGEIGKLLGEKPATVRTQLTRARRLLRKQLKEEE